MAAYKLDRTAFWSGKVKDQEKRDVLYWKNKSVEERLAAAWYLTCMAYGLDPDNPPRMDKTVFSSRMHTNQ